jgi:hypothetical protein
MFKPNSGRKTESQVWKYFIHDKSTDVSRCIVTISDTNKNGDKKEECGQTLVGKNATNLRNHLRSKHKKLYADIEATETQSKREKETKKLSSAATQVQVTKISTYYSYTHLK